MSHSCHEDVSVYTCEGSLMGLPECSSDEVARYNGYCRRAEAAFIIMSEDLVEMC